MMRPMLGNGEETAAKGPSPTIIAVTAIGALLAVVAAFFMQPASNLQHLPGTSASVTIPATATLKSNPGNAPFVAASATGAATPSADQPASLDPGPSSDPHQKLANMMNQMVETHKTRSMVVGRPGDALAFAPPAPVPNASTLQPSSLTGPATGGAPSAAAPSAGASPDTASSTQAANSAAKAIQNGDIETARSILEASMKAGDRMAVLALAETYDPNVLSAMKVNASYADVTKAHELYAEAQQAGIRAARQRLARLKKFERHH